MDESDRMDLSRRRLLEVGAGGMAALGGCASVDDGRTLPEAVGTDGHVAYASVGGSGTIDPERTSTPIQDAISQMDNQGTGGGVIWLPLGEVTEEGPITGLARCSIIGWGTGRGLPGEHASTLTIDGGGDGIRVGDGLDLNWTYLHNFTLKAHDRADGRAAIRFTGSYTPRFFNMGVVRFQNWTETERGVISFETSHPWSCAWNAVSMVDVRGSGIYCGHNPLAVWIGQFTYISRPGAAGPSGRGSEGAAVDIDNASPKIQISSLNAGGWVNRSVDCDLLFSNGALELGMVNHEPTQMPDAETDVPIRLGGKGYVDIGSVRATSVAVDYVVEFGFENQRNHVRDVRAQPGTTIRQSKVLVSSEPGGPSWYYGPGSDITATTQSTTQYVRALASAGDGFG